ncbi:MAG: pilus assembly protein N-terminal domain-containing protein [Pseudomonadota bacterium]
MKSWIVTGLLLASAGLQAQTLSLPAAITLTVGDSQILLADIRRVALGSGKIVSITTPERGQLLLLGESAGHTTAQLWLRDGSRHVLQINVHDQDLTARLEEVRQLLVGVAGVTARIVSDRILLEGDRVSEADHQRAISVVSLFPGLVLDFVGRLGWETMVQLDVRIVEVRRDQLRQLGLRWDSTITGPEVSIRAGGGQGVHVSATLATTLGSRIDLLQQRGLAQTVAEPTLSCRSGGVARFISGGEVPIPVTDGLGAVDVQYKEYGVILEVRPRAESNGGIYAEVDVELSQVDSSVRVRDYPGFVKRRTSTAINAQAGETIAIAGLLARENSRDRQGIPGLSDLPVGSGLFASTKRQQRQTELVVLITPHRFEAGIENVSHPGPQQQGLVDRANALTDPHAASGSEGARQ